MISNEPSIVKSYYLLSPNINQIAIDILFSMVKLTCISQDKANEPMWSSIKRHRISK